jgi:hypothetical protein
MIQARQILYLLLGCLCVFIILVFMQFIGTTTIVPIILDLLSFFLLIISIVSLARRRTQSSFLRPQATQQKQTVIKSQK